MQGLHQEQDQQAVRLYRCYSCNSIRLFELIRKGQTLCPKCGETKVKYAPPTLRYIIAYILKRDDWSFFRKVKELLTTKVLPA